MERASFAEMECPIARAADELGDGWTMLILREAYKGARSFADFQQRLPIAPATLTRKLETLVTRGFFDKSAYQTRPLREHYLLTAKALDLLPVLLALGEWGNRWLAPEGEILSLVDADSGKAMALAIVDGKTGKPLRAGHVALKPGKGASVELRQKLKSPLPLGAADKPADA